MGQTVGSLRPWRLADEPDRQTGGHFSIIYAGHMPERPGPVFTVSNCKHGRTTRGDQRLPLAPGAAGSDLGGHVPSTAGQNRSTLAATVARTG